jgi:MFS family permease
MSKKRIEFAPARDSIPLGYETTNLERNSVDQHASQEYPEGGLAAWLVVAGSFSMLACTFGMMSSVGVLQSYWETHQLQAYTSSTVGWVSAVFLFLNLSLGLQVGPLFDRYGPQWIMICGSVLYALSIFLLGNCNKYYEFMLCLGVLGGSSSAFVSTPSLSVLSHWFQRRRGTAIGIAMTGSSLGGIIFPLMLRATLERFGWAWALRVLGFIFIFFLTMGNICIRSRESSLHKKPKGTVDLQCFADSRFVWATLGVFCMFHCLTPHWTAQ